MRILEIILFEFLLGYVLQAFSIVLGLYAFNRRKIDVKKYVVTSLIMSVVIYGTRLLPVAFGVHTVLDYAVLFLLGIMYLQMSVSGTIKACFISVALLILLEFVWTILLTALLGQNKFLGYVNNEPTRSLLGLPSAISFTCTIFLIYLLISQAGSRRSKSSRRYVNENTWNHYF